MGMTMIAELSCDIQECQATLRLAESTIETLKTELQESGWRRVHGKYTDNILTLCPSCTRVYNLLKENNMLNDE